jgi:glucosamine-6-phosphate deaminase
VSRDLLAPRRPRVLVLPDAEAVAQAACAEVLGTVGAARAEGRDPVLGLATGATPRALYRLLAEAAPEVGLADVRGVALDEYVGLPPDDPRRYRDELVREVVEPWGLDPERLLVPDVDADDLDLAAATFDDRLVALGGVDLQVLGIGRNGHIGFNEPGSSWRLGTRRVRLSPSTREANAAYFDSLDAVPSAAVTQGIATILRARRLLLVATGAAKADAVAAAVAARPSPRCPASVIQFHPEALVVVDDAAAAGLDPATGPEG